MLTTEKTSTVESERPVFSPGPAPQCPLCGQSQTQVIHFPDLLEPFVHCPPWHAHDKNYCGPCHYIWSDRFAGMELSDYGREYVQANTDAQRVPNERMHASPKLLDRMLAWTEGRRFLDYGVGYNTPYVDEVRALGLDLWACDMCDAVPYGGHVVKLPEQRELLGPDPFDGIFSQDVVEHFSDPVSDFRRLGSMLRPGGLILASTPVLEKVWDGAAPITRHIWLWTPWHTSIASTTAMERLAKLANLEFVSVVPVPTDTKWAFLLRKPSSCEQPPCLDREGSDETCALRASLHRYMDERCWL